MLEFAMQRFRLASRAKATLFAGRCEVLGSRQKPRFLPAVYEVMSAEIAVGDFSQ